MDTPPQKTGKTAIVTEIKIGPRIETGIVEKIVTAIEKGTETETEIKTRIGREIETEGESLAVNLVIVIARREHVVLPMIEIRRNVHVHAIARRGHDLEIRSVDQGVKIAVGVKVVARSGVVVGVAVRSVVVRVAAGTAVAAAAGNVDVHVAEVKLPNWSCQ